LFLLLKTVHILSATLLFGTGLGSAFTCGARIAAALIAGVSRQAVWADWLFTVPAVILQPLTGLWLMALAGHSFDALWLKLSLVLYLLAVACWLPVVWLQIRIQRLAAGAIASRAPLSALYHRLRGFWFWLGWPAFLAVLAAFFVMVVKPL